MNYKEAPVVLHTTPANGSTGVPTSMTPSVRLSMDLDLNYLEGNVQLLDAHGQGVVGSLKYADRVVTFRPAQPLATGAQYRLVVVGDTPDDGVVTGLRSVLGTPMLGVKEYVFMTVDAPTLPAPLWIWPKNGSVLNNVDDFLFEWQPVPGGVVYECQVSRYNDFATVVFPSPTSPQITGTQVRIGSPAEGLYYARVRATDAGGYAGAWSSINSVNLTLTAQKPVTLEDMLPPDVATEPPLGFGLPAVVTESYPTNEWPNVALNLRKVRFVLTGLSGLTAEDLKALITPATVKIQGESVDPGDMDLADHGPITAFVDVEVTQAGDQFEVLITLPEVGGV